MQLIVQKSETLVKLDFLNIFFVTYDLRGLISFFFKFFVHIFADLKTLKTETKTQKLLFQKNF